MRKVFMVLFSLVFSSFLIAGDISNTVFTDTAIGLSSGAAVGALTALGPYSSGKNPAVFGAGTGLGAMIGGFCGFAAGIWHAVYQASNKKMNSQTLYELEIAPAYSGLVVKTNF